MAMRIKLSLRRKILLACYFLACILLVGAYFINRLSVTEAADRGRFLEKHELRFLNYQARIGHNLTALVQVMVEANRSALVQALGAPEGSTEAIRRQLIRPLHAHLKPDFLAVVDARGRLVAKGRTTPLEQSETASMRLITDVLQGTVVGRLPVGQLFRESGEVLVHRSRVYQIAGVPLRDDEGKVIAAVAVGVNIEQYFRDYQAQSDDRAPKQHRLTFVHQDKVLASVFPEAEWDDLAPALRKAAARMADTSPESWAFQHRGKTWDFDMAPITGYAGTLHGRVGRLFIMRTREHKKAELSAMYQENKLYILVGGLLTLLVGWVLSWLITRPLERFIAATQDVAAGKGDLSKRLHFKSRDEFAQLGENINRIFSNLQALASDVQNAGLQVGASSAQIGTSSRQMLDGAKDQALRVESSSPSPSSRRRSSRWRRTRWRPRGGRSRAGPRSAAPSTG
jgi:HAMP domain-containing protein